MTSAALAAIHPPHKADSIAVHGALSDLAGQGNLLSSLKASNGAPIRNHLTDFLDL